MADHNTLQHVFVSGYADGTDATLVRPSNWNKEHHFAGGTNLQYLMFDNTQTDSVRFDNVWARMPVIDVTKAPYNVPNDGVTDAQSSITSMVAAIGSAGATLYFPPGTYVTTSANPLISLTDSNANLTILGSGAAGSILQQKGAGSIIRINGTSAQHNIRIQGFEMDGQSNAAQGVYGSNAWDVWVRECYFLNVRGPGVQLDGAGTVGVQVQNCTFTSSTAQPANTGAITQTAGGYSLIEQCIFLSSQYLTAIWLVGATNTVCQGCYLAGANWSGNAIVLTGSYTELGNYYATGAGFTNYIWDWRSNDSLTVIGSNGTIDLIAKVNTTGRSPRALTFLQGAPSGVRPNQVIGALQLMAGDSFTQMTGRGRLNTQVLSPAVGNGADTTDDTLATYTIPANVLAQNGQTVRVECALRTAATANTRTIKLWVGSTTVVASGTVAMNNFAFIGQMRILRLDATHILAHGMLVSNNGSTQYTGSITSTAVSDLTANTLIVKVTGASPSSTASDVLCDSFAVYGDN